MKWVAVMLAVLGSSGLAWGVDAAVLVFRNGEVSTEERYLLEALRIYTRDLPCRILVTGRT